MEGPSGNKECITGLNDPEKLMRIQSQLLLLQTESSVFLQNNPEQDKPEKEKSVKKIKLTKEEVIYFNPEIFDNAEEYYRYISSNIENVDDIMAVLNGFITYYEDPQNRVHPAEVTLAAGFGDCDNYAWLAKKLLDDLGCRKNFNFNARVIGLGDHAVCIYTERNGDTYSIDQHKRIKTTSIYEASPLFEPFKDPSNEIEETVLYGKDVEARITLDQTMKNNYERILFMLYKMDFSRDFSPRDALPEDWNKYKITQVNFKDESGIIYKNGKLFSIFDKSKNERDVFDEDGDLKQRDFSDGKWATFYKGTGKIRQINYPEKSEIKNEVFTMNGTILQKTYKDGSFEVFYENTDKIYQKNYASGDVAVEVFDLQGKLTQRNFRNGIREAYNPETGKVATRYLTNGTSEVYDPKSGVLLTRYFDNGDVEDESYSGEGRVMERGFRKNKKGNKREWYDKNGKLIQIKNFEGKVQIVN